MKFYSIVLISSLLLSACKLKNERDIEKGNVKNGKLFSVNPDKRKVSAKLFSEAFYNWYLNEFYIPYLDESRPDPLQAEIKQVKSEFYAVDTTRFFSILRKQPFFSKKFIANERELISVCNAAISEKEFEEEAEIFYDIKPCSFLSYNRLIGGQGEEVRAFKINSIVEQVNNAKVEVSMLDTENSPVNNVVLHLSKSKESWLIDQIEVL